MIDDREIKESCRIMEELLKMNNRYKQKRETILLKKHLSMTVYAGILIAVYPILAPYKLFGISLNWLLGIIFFIIHILKNKNYPFISSVKPLALYTVLSMVLSMNGLLVLQNPINLINTEIAMAINLILYMLLWFYSDIDVTMKYANMFGYICCGYALVQIIATISGSTVPLGQFPIFEVSTGWVSEIWGFRFNSIFSEPSYFAIYLLPLFVYNLVKSNWLKAVIFASFIVLSSSSLGIISLIIVLLLRFISSDFSLKNKIQFIVILFGVVLLANLIIEKVPDVEVFIGRSYIKIKEIFDSSLNGGFMKDMRLGGYLDLYGELPIKEQLFGVGNSQMQNYFSEQGVLIFNYSNSFVLSLINLGLLGFVVFVIFLAKLLCVSRKEKTFLFWLILIITFSVDSLLFSYRYYWLVYFVLFSNKRMEKISE